MEAACDKLLSQGVGCVLASLGAEGVMVKQSSGKGKVFGVETVEALDTTAAGDSFTAAVAYALTNGCEIEKAARFANLVAKQVVQREGAQKSIPSRDEIDNIYIDSPYSNDYNEGFAIMTDCTFCNIGLQ